MSDGQLKKVSGELTQRTGSEGELDQALLALAKQQYQSGTFGFQWNYHNLVFMKRQVLSRVLYQDQLYKRILDVPGVICEFGVQWGATLSTLINMRGMYEPYNYSRMIYGFDTFTGFPDVDAKDGGFTAAGDFATSGGYELELERILEIHEAFSPLPHIKKFGLVKGDVTHTLPTWLEENPHAIISMAIFDMDIYSPTKAALELILPRLTKGSMLVFDELNCRHFPGETAAVQEVIGLNNLRLQRFPHQPYCAFAEFGA